LGAIVEKSERMLPMATADSRGSSETSVSSLSDSDENDEHLLSEMIEAAKPKSTKKSSSWKQPPAAGAGRSSASSGVPPARVGYNRSSDGVSDAAHRPRQPSSVPPVNTFKVPQSVVAPVRTRSADPSGMRAAQNYPVGRDPNARSHAQRITAVGRMDNAQVSSVQVGMSIVPLGGEGAEAKGDSVRTYAIEGTPVSFSRSTSLSNLTIDSSDGCIDTRGTNERGDRNNSSTRAAGSRNVPSTSWQIGSNYPGSGVNRKCAVAAGGALQGNEDATRAYVVEGTPVCFSRNDSLSSLSADEDDVRNTNTHLNRTVVKKDQFTSAARLKTPAKVRVGPHGPGSTSTPVGRQGAALRSQPFVAPADDHFTRYADEGTPVGIGSCSQNISPGGGAGRGSRALSSLFGSPLSALSIESLSLEPGEAELLEECINAAMPKTKRRHKNRDSTNRSVSVSYAIKRPVQTSPSEDGGLPQANNIKNSGHPSAHGVGSYPGQRSSNGLNGVQVSFRHIPRVTGNSNDTRRVLPANDSLSSQRGRDLNGNLLEFCSPDFYKL